MTEVWAEPEDSSLAIGHYCVVNDRNNFLHNKRGKVIDMSNKLARVNIGGIVYLMNKDNLRPIQYEEMPEDSPRLMDKGSSYDKHKNEVLTDALADRKREYRRTARMQKETLETAEKVSSIMEKHQKMDEEMEAWNNGTWFDTHWEPSYEKIGATALAQAANLTQLIICCCSGPIGALVGTTIFFGGLWLNYTILDRMSRNG